MFKQFERASHRELNTLGNVINTLIEANFKLTQELDKIERKQVDTERQLEQVLAQLVQTKSQLERVESRYQVARDDLEQTEKKLIQTVEELKWAEIQLESLEDDQSEQTLRIMNIRRSKKREINQQKEPDIERKKLESLLKRKSEDILKLLQDSEEKDSRIENILFENQSLKKELKQLRFYQGAQILKGQQCDQNQTQRRDPFYQNQELELEYQEEQGLFQKSEQSLSRGTSEIFNSGTFDKC